MDERKESEQPHSRWGMNMHFGRDSNSWMFGLILILIGAIFLIGNLTGYALDNWWALFILFPALGSFSSALNHYRSSGSLDRRVRSHLFWGFFFVLLSGAFLFGYSFSLLWPAFLILAGLGMLLGAF